MSSSSSETYYERLSTVARAEDGVAFARPVERCRHRHDTIAEARKCDRLDLDDIGEFSDDAEFYRYVEASENDEEE